MSCVHLGTYLVVHFLFLFLLILRIHAVAISATDLELQTAFHRLESSPHMRGYPTFNKVGRLNALMRAVSDDPQLRNLMVKETLEKLAEQCPSGREDYGEKQRAHPHIRFPCSVPPPTSSRASTVHGLTAGDIEVVAALGDSITTGRGIDACTVQDLQTEYRGRAFSAGGDGNLTSNPTLPNVLRLYNPHLIGFSLWKGNSQSPNAHFNVARSGASSLELMDQARDLVQRMRAELLTDSRFRRVWKLVTIFLGNNDLCDYCETYSHSMFTPDLFRERLQRVLDYLQQQMPRTLVNVITPLEMVSIERLHHQQGFMCKLVHFVTCRCAAYPKVASDAERFNNAYQAAVREVLRSGRYDHDPEFTVVEQPFFKDAFIPLKKSGNNVVDASFFAPDCLHLSGKGQAALAVTLWNSMFQPVGEKRTTWWEEEGFVFTCPDPSYPFIRTSRN